MKADQFRSRTRPAEHTCMRSTRTPAAVPRPIEVVLQHHGDLQTAYVHRRAAQDRTDAFVGAVSEVLSDAEVSDLSRLISGSFDANYDATRGAEFGELLLDDLEQSYQDMRRTHTRNRRWHALDAPEVVEALATDRELADLFTQALEEHNETTAAALVTSAVRVVVEKASASHNAPDTRRGLLAAASAFREHAAGGRSEALQLLLDDAPREPALSDAILTTWCEALSDGVNAAL
jgi:hypothetical protein